jgi:O-antigen/teichoic acid export membrane protein
VSQHSAEHQRRLDVHFAGGVAWTAGAKWFTQIFSWAALFVSARLLSTSDFGISDMASYSFLLTNLLAEFGIGTAVLQMRELEPGVLAQLHSFSCLLCTLVYVASLPTAPLLAHFFHNDHLTALIMVNNLAFFLTGFQAVPLGLLQRDMDYRRLSLAEALQALTQALATVISAWLGLGYWSLIVGGGCGKVTAIALVSSWKRVPFAVPHWKDIQTPIRLGWHTAVGRLAWSCYTQADGIVVGRALGGAVLGSYRMSMNLASAPAEKVSTLIMRAAGPLFARVQGDDTLVRRYFLILTEALTVIELPLMLGLGIMAPEMVQVVLGPKWSAVVTPLRWLVLFMTLRTLGTLMEQVLISQRRTGFTMRMSLMNLCVMPVALYLAAGWKGTSGVAAAWVLLAPLTILPLAWKVSKTIHLGFRGFASALLPATVGVAVMAGALLALRTWLALKPWPAIISLALQVSVGGAVYGGVLLALFRERVLRYTRFLRGIDRAAAAHPPLSS